MPGIEVTGSRLLSPSATTSDQIKSLVVSVFSRTRRRAHSAFRLRRRRVVRWSAVTGLPRSVRGGVSRDSIGRPNLIALEVVLLRPALAPPLSCVTARVPKFWIDFMAANDQSCRDERRFRAITESAHGADQRSHP